MDPPLLSDDERRVLLEYRISKVPTRRQSKDQMKQSRQQMDPHSQQSCSSASSFTSTSSSSVGTAAVEQPRPSKKSSSISNHHQTQTVSPRRTQDRQLPSQKSKSQSPQQHQADRNNRHNHFHQKNHGHDHHHHHRKHKSTTPTLELTADELTKMLDLASGLSYLKLVSPMRISNGSQTNAKATQQNCNIDLSKDNLTAELENEGSGNNKANNGGTTNQSTFTHVLNINCNDNSTKLLNGTKTSVGRSFMFEKVDYIKKINIRKKALKKLKKTRDKSCSFPPSSVNNTKSTADV